MRAHDRDKMLGKRLPFFVCFIGVSLSLFHEIECRTTKSSDITPIYIEVKCGEKKRLSCYTEDGLRGIIMNNDGSYVETSGELVLNSVTSRDEGLYKCYRGGNSLVLLRQYNVIVSRDLKHSGCK